MSNKLNELWDVIIYFYKSPYNIVKALIGLGGLLLVTLFTSLPSISCIYFEKIFNMTNLCSSEYGTSGWYIGIIISLLLIGAGIFIYREKEDKNRAVVIESRGLANEVKEPLENAVIGSIIPIHLDFLDAKIDKKFSKPEKAIQELACLQYMIKKLDKKFSLKFIYGGLTPVPVTFLMGVLFDDEKEVTIYDWHRDDKKWLKLNKEDDKKRFKISGIDIIPNGIKEVVLSIETSGYPVDKAYFPKKLESFPQVEMILEDRNFNAHWSEEKQVELAKQFMDLVLNLYGKGVEKIHLFLVSQNSFVFRLGTIYDQRNLPKISVYQFEQLATGKGFPWCIDMPVAGQDEATVTYT